MNKCARALFVFVRTGTILKTKNMCASDASRKAKKPHASTGRQSGSLQFYALRRSSVNPRRAAKESSATGAAVAAAAAAVAAGAVVGSAHAAMPE